MDDGDSAAQPSLLGSYCAVRGGDAAVRRGQLLEVRRLWSPSGAAAPLYGFVRVKDTDHRLSGWFPLDEIELKESAVPITRPLLSGVYTEVTAGMSRAQREGKVGEYFEERLLRDCRTPTSVRYFVYLGTFVFAPWYYAPYGVLNGDYDVTANGRDDQTRDDTHRNTYSETTHATFQTTHTAPTTEAANTSAATTSTSGWMNPYIRDAFLCPFSLRVYATLDQMRRETQRYRKRRLRPPGVEIYRDDARGFSLFEVNGSLQVTYCRHLFLLGKSFLENKLAGHDVHNYYFYVLCLHQRHFPQYIDDPSAVYFVGYFTWEKQVAAHNLACIVTLPCFAGGAPGRPALGHIGQFMIAASYEMAYRRKHIGSPERPLSDLGALAYERYWSRVLVAWMHRMAHTEEAAITILSSESEGGSPRPRHTKGGKSAKSGKSHVEVELLLEEAEGEAESASGVTANGRREVVAVVTVRSIAREVRLEEADVLRTLLAMGVLHRNAEDRSTRLVIPVPFVTREHAKTVAMMRDMRCAAFDPAKLNTTHIQKAQR